MIKESRANQLLEDNFILTRAESFVSTLAFSPPPPTEMPACNINFSINVCTAQADCYIGTGIHDGNIYNEKPKVFFHLVCAESV